MNELMINKASDFILFAKVVEAGGFTAASRHIGVPQASISRRIADLEKVLNVRLLERSTRKVSITDAGMNVYKHARRMLNELENAQSIAESLNTQPSGLIRITVSPVLGQYILAGLVADFAKKYPAISFQIELTGRRVDLIGEGFDLAIRVGDLKLSSLIKIPLIRTNESYYASHDLAAKITKIHQFHDAAWLCSSADLSSTHRKLLDQETLRLIDSYNKKPVIASNDIEVVIKAAEQGLGIANLPDLAAPNTLVKVLPNYIARRVEINALAVSRRSILPGVRLFIEFIRKRLNTE